MALCGTSAPETGRIRIVTSWLVLSVVVVATWMVEVLGSVALDVPFVLHAVAVIATHNTVVLNRLVRDTESPSSTSHV